MSEEGLKLIISDAYKQGYKDATERILKILKEDLYDNFYSNGRDEEKIQRILTHIIAETTKVESLKFAEDYLKNTLLREVRE